MRFTSHFKNPFLETSKRNCSVIDLVLEGYLAHTASIHDHPKRMDTTFKALAASQIKQFLFFDHETTSCTICYIFHLLSRNRAAVDRLRVEYANTFGHQLNEQELATLLCEQPHFLDQLPFTVAVINETLRLFPSVSSTRAGEPGYSVVNVRRHQCSTEGYLVWYIRQAKLRDPAYWPEPNTFLPERWLIPYGDSLHPIKETWRALEHGPRHCSGQELAMVEMKIVMIMVLSLYDIHDAYDGWGLKFRKKERP